MDSPKMKEMLSLARKEHRSSFGKSGQVLAFSTIIARYKTRYPIEVSAWQHNEKLRIYGRFNGHYGVLKARAKEAAETLKQEALKKELERYAEVAKTVKSDWNTFHPPGCYCCESK